MTDVVESTAVEEPGTDVVLSTDGAAGATTLFRTHDPIEVVERATAVANALHSVIEDKKLYSIIKGRKHVQVEGWTLLGSLLGVTPVTTWTRRVEKGWEARVEARTLDGRVIGAAEAECLTTEKRWKDAEDYAVRSMAQTRATSKALRSVLAFVVTLAGYEATPAEEMDGVAPAAPEKASKDQVQRLGAICYQEVGEEAFTAALNALTGEDTETPVADRVVALTHEQAALLISQFEKAQAS